MQSVGHLLQQLAVSGWNLFGQQRQFEQAIESRRLNRHKHLHLFLFFVCQ